MVSYLNKKFKFSNSTKLVQIGEKSYNVRRAIQKGKGVDTDVEEIQDFFCFSMYFDVIDLFH